MKSLPPLPPARVPAEYAAKFVAASRNPSPGGSLASGLCLSARPAKFDTGRVHGPHNKPVGPHAIDFDPVRDGFRW